MTTIVADSRVGLIGADRYCTSGYYSRKIFKTKGKGLIACAGDDRAISRFEAWMLYDGPRPNQISDGSGEEFEALQLYKGKVYLWELALRPTLIEEGYFAIGSGGQYALGALDAGADIFTAMKLAAHRADGTKPPFEYMDARGRVYSGDDLKVEK